MKVIVEQLENDLLLFEACRLGKHLDFDNIPRRKIAVADMFQVVNHLFARVDEELTLGLEMTALKNQVNCYGDRIHTVNQIALCRTQIAEEAPVIFRKVWQTEKIVDFLGGQDRQAAGAGDHAELTFCSAESLLFARRVETAFYCTGQQVSSAKTVAENKMQFPPICATFLHYGSSQIHSLEPGTASNWLCACQ